MLLDFDVDYYDSEHERLFANSPAVEEIRRLVDEGFSVDPLDLLGASMFMEQKDQPGWRTRDDLTHLAGGRLDEFMDYYDLESRTLVAQHDAGDMRTSNIERAGVGATISAMDRAFGTHAADWERLAIGQRKDLDFRVASTGERFVILESKGSIVEDVTRKTSSISQQKSRIIAKKETQRPDESRDVYIGAIAAIPRNDGRNARIWLVDPPIPQGLSDPRRFRLLARLRTYAALISLIGKPHLLIALNTRIRALESTLNIGALDAAPLVNASGETFDVPVSFVTARTKTVDQRYMGFVRRIGSRFVFLGIARGVIKATIGQSHSEILSWGVSRARRRTAVELTRDDAALLERQARSRYAQVDLMVNPAGIALGVGDIESTPYG